jgi:hypothetical protein
MIRVIEKFYDCGIAAAVDKKKEGFEGQLEQPSPMRAIIPTILSLITILILQLLVGKWLWNTFLVKALSIVNPLESVWQLLGISFLLCLLKCN